MEELFVYALLYSVGFDVWDMYSDTLDKLFMKNPENEDYLSLEGMTPKDAVLHSIYIMSTSEINTEYFGKVLMKAMKQIYENTTLEIFEKKMYSLWSNLPDTIDSQEPFFTLCYAGDCLFYGDERQCRELYEKAMCYYD